MKIYPVIARSAFALVLMLSAALYGCANVPVSSEKIAVAEAAVERANTRSTSERAPGELQIAIAKLASAKQALAAKNHKLAAQLFDQAILDAQVAELRAETVRSQLVAKEFNDASQVLRKEMNRN